MKDEQIENFIIILIKKLDVCMIFILNPSQLLNF